MKKVLFVCIGNSCRSQMAEGFLNDFVDKNDGGMEAYSAGLISSSLNEKTVEVMKEVGIDISHQYSKTIDSVNIEAMDIVVTMCKEARCAYLNLPPNVVRVDWEIADPILAQKTEEFRKIRDEVKEKVRKLESLKDS